MKLYTKSGDDGTTGLFGGQRVSKDHPRVEAYGSVDEFNAAVGLAAAACDTNNTTHERFAAILHDLQSRLFDIGADLATPPGDQHESKIARITDEQVAEVEKWIDEIEAANEPMTHFILPGGTELAARLHVARTVCRRAERRIIHAAREETIGENLRRYFNRLGDLFFAMARQANAAAGVSDVQWIGPGERKASGEA